MCEKCDKGIAAYKVALAEFDAKYPFACKKCGGSGEIEYQDDPGDRNCGLAGGTMTFTDVCPDCEGADKPVCAVCGKPMPYEDKYERECCAYVQRPIAETFFDPDCPCAMPSVESVAEAIAEDLFDFTEEG